MRLRFLFMSTVQSNIHETEGKTFTFVIGGHLRLLKQLTMKYSFVYTVGSNIIHAMIPVAPYHGC